MKLKRFNQLNENHIDNDEVRNLETELQDKARWINETNIIDSDDAETDSNIKLIEQTLYEMTEILDNIKILVNGQSILFR